MCGIAGAFRKPAKDQVNAMLKILSHRGPDGHGMIELPNATLGHTRLAILDVACGHQPMEVANTWITFNGEIYNFRELRQRYLSDQDLKTQTDTEVLVCLYRMLGPSFVELLDGMFAFAIVDEGELFMARDPLGIKPIYCGENQEIFYFASEIKALSVIVENIREFPAGHWYHSRLGWHCFYEVPQATPTYSEGEAQATLDIQATLEDAVRKRMIADVPIGISLSGGLDSSIVAMLASRYSSQLNSFAVGMEGSEDLRAARIMAGVLNTCHHERVYTEMEMLSALPKVIYHLESFDPALVRSAIPNYFLAEFASKFVKVILTGEGADEIFAGYDYLGVIQSEIVLQREMIRITEQLHNTNLQRADRVAMAFGLEARVPFLDKKSVSLSLSLPTQWKVHQNSIPKFILRNAFADHLPTEIVRRPKQKFSKGAGSSDVLAHIANGQISDEEFAAERARILYEWNYRLPNKEAFYYYKILREFYYDQWIFPTMGHSQSL
jgi:asparagine synthase (glutamine-hydrolysing)